MEEDTPTPDPILFPFELTIEQAQNLNNLTAEQWIKHCQNVRSNHPWTEPEINRFLSLLIEEIVRIFHGAVEHLVASSTPPTDPPTPSPAPSSSTPDPSTSTPYPALPVPLPTADIPAYPLVLTKQQLDQCADYSDVQFYFLARNLKNGNWKKGMAQMFFKSHPIEMLATSIKQF